MSSLRGQFDSETIGIGPVYFLVLLLLPGILDGNAWHSNKSCCPLQSSQVTKELVPQSGAIGHVPCVQALWSGQSWSRCWLVFATQPQWLILVVLPGCGYASAEPGIHRGNKHSRGNENQKSWKNIFPWKKIDKYTFFSMKIKMMDLWMQIEGTKLIFIMNFCVLDFFKFTTRMLQLAQILVSTFKFSRAAYPRTLLENSSFFFISNFRLCSGKPHWSVTVGDNENGFTLLPDYVLLGYIRI